MKKRCCWLLKSEPSAYSFDDLLRDGTTCWDGVRNYQARGYLRDDMRTGDGVLFYHSGGESPAIVGTAVVVREGYPDFTQFDPTDAHFDPAATPDAPRWYMVDIRAETRLARPLSLPELRTSPALADMVLLKKGSRLSVQPVSVQEWNAVIAMAGASAGGADTAGQPAAAARRTKPGK